MSSSISKGCFRISKYALVKSDIFSFVCFLVCLFLKKVAFEADLSSDEAVGGLSVDDGVKVD